MHVLRFGDVTVERCVESEGPSFFPGFLLPDFDAGSFERHRHWLDPWAFDAASGRLVMSLHSYVIRTPRHTILVDTCVGNDKERPDTKPWHRRDGPFLHDLAAMGVHPEDVDFVLCTHLHVDHVGWNTRLADGRWVPTFPNATYLFHRDEYAHWASSTVERGAGAGTTGRASFNDSVAPVVEAGRALLVDGDHAIDDTLWLEPSAGHSPGHVCLNLRSGGRAALFTGDAMHHPVQVAFPEWNSRFCHDPVRSRATREALVARCADTPTVVLAAHFPMPVAGRVASAGERACFVPVDAEGVR